MTDPARFDALSAGLAEGVAVADGLIGLVLLGSAADPGAPRRDEWSDHDFFAITEAGAGARLRPGLSWLPDRDRLVLTAREGEFGFVAVYDDGHVFEFAYADAGELDDAVVGDASVLVDDDAGTTATLVRRAQARAEAADAFDAENDVRLALVKLLIGVGRVRRGEVIVGGWFVRTWAVQHLVRAIRGRFGDRSTSQRDTIDPARRFERDFPEWGAEIAAALDRDAESAAHHLFALTRRVLEPGWSGFPTRAADAVAERAGWGGVPAPSARS